MYHAQVPPPHNTFNPSHPGITWVDLVFPFFLFAMGAAFPFAMSKKLDAGEAKWKLIIQTLKRGLLLAWFAIYIQHIKPWAISGSPDTKVWLFSLLGFALIFPMLMRLPETLKKWQMYAIRFIGYGGAILMVYLLEISYKENPTFSGFLEKSDIIILVLANVAVAGTLIWIFTRDNLLIRLGILGFLIAFRLAHNSDGSWTQWVWGATPFDWLYTFYYWQYLFIVIPGTIVGDMILKWMKDMKNTELKVLSLEKMIIGAILMLVIVIFNLYGLYTRILVINLIVNIALCIIGYFVFLNPKNKTEKFFQSLFNWGVYWLFLGLTFEAFEGGIKKDSPTMSYYFTTTGLAIFTYISMSIVIDYFQYVKWYRLLIDSGQNPMIAYLGASNIIVPVFTLVQVMPLLSYLDSNPWLGFLKGLLITVLVALIAAFFTRKKLFWRT
jgi:predicted acyltransferase